MTEKQQIRLNKFLAESGVCSRREADKLIAEGRVAINGKAAGLGASVHDGVSVTVNGKPVQRKNQKVVLAYYKPVGVTCTEKDRHAEKTITDVLQYPVRVTYAGRLDKDSEGLMLMTNDGDLIHAMMQGANRHEKEYIVKVNKEVTDAHLWTMMEGVYLEELEQRTRPCRIERMGKYTCRVVLTQGLNRQIRRMFHKFGYHVVSIRRIRVLNIQLGELRAGAYRAVEGEELMELYRQAGLMRADQGLRDSVNGAEKQKPARADQRSRIRMNGAGEAELMRMLKRKRTEQNVRDVYGTGQTETEAEGHE
ncbi:MAG: rRNA pseudouridine synthase [Lachnospiraceae bacterium]|nr:rRNA pseudouridine synthase [Lachnospiraceae bacterium]